MDAVKTSGLRMLKAIGIGTDATTMHSYLGWEQEMLAQSAFGACFRGSLSSRLTSTRAAPTS